MESIHHLRHARRMPRPDLSDDELQRAALAARVVANQHEQQSRRVSGSMKGHFIEQSKRYRALAARFEETRELARRS